MNFTKNKEIKQRQNYYSITSNRSPQPFNKIKNNLRSYERSPVPNITKNFEVEENLEENININDYLNNKQVNFYQSKKRLKGRSPENVNKIQNNNYYNFNRNYYNNYNPNIMKHFESDDFEDKNTNINNKEENNNYNKNKNWKKKILQIKEQNTEEYEQYINKNYNNNNVYNYNNYYNGNYYNNNYNEANTYNPMNKENKEIRPKKNDNFKNYRNYNNNKSKDREIYNNNTDKNFHYHKYSKDHKGLNNNNYLSDVNIKKNTKNQYQTQENYYKKKYKKLNQNNNDSSSSNIYDESYDYKTQYNFKKAQKDKYRNFPKFYSASSQENSYSDNNKEDEVYNTTPFRPPLKNDEEHYHQNLTIKTKNPLNENNNDITEKKNRKIRLNINNENLSNLTQQFKEKNKSYVETKTNIEFPNLNKYKNKNEFSMRFIKKINNNRSPENFNKKIEEEKKKKIKEITVDLSPKKKLNLANSNQNLGSRINRLDNMTASNTFNINPNSKIESCIIKFDKNQKNDIKNKLSNSLDRFDLNKIRYIKKKVITTYNRKNSPTINETPGNDFNSPYNLTNSAKKTYQKPSEKMQDSPQQFYTKLENLEMSGEVKDYCAPSPNYGKKGKEAYLNSQKNKINNLNNNSPLLTSSGKFQIFDSNKKDNNSPYYNKKYDEFSFREKNSDISDINYSNGQKVEVNIINNDNINEINNEKNIIKNKNKANENFTIFCQQRMPTFSNMEFVNKNENEIIKDNKENKDNKDNKEIINEPKLVIKSFRNKKKEIKEKPILAYNFYKKYYDIYISLPQKENILMTKLNQMNQLNQNNEKEKSYEEIENKNYNNKLINAQYGEN